MGEMADWTIENGMIWDDYDRDQDRVCKYCGKRGLVWFEARGKWRLCDNVGNIHKCDRYRK